ncbi:ExeA family protein [Hydrogenophaga flava]|uniref:ExeA family protein n=1 Tax=Hydrogenophaga flava TaxID=65657 RepID=UPI0008266AFB|nr:ExeA family protein [Hydrogenophaga flava]
MNARNSHLATLGLVRNPFPYTPDAGCYFTTPHLEEQRVELEHCILSRKGFCLLTAEVGMGKSTLVRRLMADLAPRQVVSALVFNTFLQGPELLSAVLQDFGLQGTGSMATDINVLNNFLLDNHREGRTCLLIIDDAQNLTESSLELIRLLCNLETDQEKLLQILLAGQPELEATLAQHSLRQLRSRVVKHARLYGLNSMEIADYIRFRFESSGSDGSLLLQADACQLLLQETAGVPRQVHLVMDRCLYGLAARNGKVIDAALMKQAIQDCRIQLDAGAAEPAPSAPVLPAVAAAATPVRRWAPLAAALSVLAVAAVLWYQGALPVQARAVSPVAAPAAAPAAAAAKAPEPEKAAAPAPEAAPAVALQAAASASAPAAAQNGACAAPPSLAQDRVLTTQPLPELAHRLLGSRLARLDDVCLESRQGQPWITWAAPAAGYDDKDRLSAARFQIALTRYGSLLPADVDGVWGEKSRNALQRFQSGIGLEPTGKVDPLSGLILEKFYVQEQ